MLYPPGRTVEDQLAADGRRDVGPGDLLEHDRRLDVAQPHAAPLLADGDAEQVGGGQGLPLDCAMGWDSRPGSAPARCPYAAVAARRLRAAGALTVRETVS